MGGIVWMGTMLIIGSSKSTVGEVNFGTFGRGFLLGFCFLEPRRLGRSPRFTELEIVFLFPVWTAGFWTTKGVVSSWTWTSSSPLVTAFSLFSFIVAIPMAKKTNLGKKKKKKEGSGQHLLRRVVSTCPRFSAVGIGPSPQAARRLKVTRSWKDLSENERT